MRQVCPGHFIRLDVSQGYAHSVGGEHDLHGAECPNCRKPLMLHATLDSTDERLNLRTSRTRLLPLLYCLRCALAYDTFSYRLVDERTIQQLEVYRGETNWEEFYEDVPTDVLPRRSVGLEPIPWRLQELCNLLNRPVYGESEVTDAQIREYGILTGQEGAATDPEVNIIWVRPINQVGGRPYLVQNRTDPICPFCCTDPELRAQLDNAVHRANVDQTSFTHEWQMHLLCTMTNDKRNSFRIGMDGLQALFFWCGRCSTIIVQNSID